MGVKPGQNGVPNGSNSPVASSPGPLVARRQPVPACGERGALAIDEGLDPRLPPLRVDHRLGEEPRLAREPRLDPLCPPGAHRLHDPIHRRGAPHARRLLREPRHLGVRQHRLQVDGAGLRPATPCLAALGEAPHELSVSRRKVAQQRRGGGHGPVVAVGHLVDDPARQRLVRRNRAPADDHSSARTTPSTPSRSPSSRGRRCVPP
jgi:hypothetical protein